MKFKFMNYNKLLLTSFFASMNFGRDLMIHHVIAKFYIFYTRRDSYIHFLDSIAMMEMSSGTAFIKHWKLTKKAMMEKGGFFQL